MNYGTTDDWLEDAVNDFHQKLDDKARREAGFNLENWWPELYSVLKEYVDRINEIPIWKDKIGEGLRFEGDATDESYTIHNSNYPYIVTFLTRKRDRKVEINWETTLNSKTTTEKKVFELIETGPTISLRWFGRDEDYSMPEEAAEMILGRYVDAIFKSV